MQFLLCDQLWLVCVPICEGRGCLGNSCYRCQISIQAMIEKRGTPHLTSQQINLIIDNLLKIPKTHKLIHPCQERTRYSNILDWLTFSMNALKAEESPPNLLAQKQQQIIVSSLTELIELTRKECLEKSIILEILLEYFISTINSYWQMFSNASKEVTYEYEHNAVQIEKEYVATLKSLQAENEELRRDKDHRWRNMFMLIKDNRVHRKQNKKLIKSIEYEMEKNKGLAEQMIKLQQEGQKMRLKIADLQGNEANLDSFIDANLGLIQLQKKIREYPKKSKKILKNDLLKIEISQSKNLQDKIQFIIKAMEETGEIIDEIYDDNVIWSHFSYNISTQTDLKMEDKAVNTQLLKLSHADTQVHPKELIDLDLVETVYLKVLPPKKERKDTSRESKNVMFATTNNLAKYNYTKREGESKSRHGSKRADFKSFSLCESLKITIFQGRIYYISTYSTQIFNTTQTINQGCLQKYLSSSVRSNNTKPTCIEAEIQTDIMNEEAVIATHCPMPRLAYKANLNSKTNGDFQHHYLDRKQIKRGSFFEISQQTDYCFDPDRQRHRSRVKLSLNSEKSSDNLRTSTIKKITRDRYFETKREAQQGQKDDKHPDIRSALKRIMKSDDKDSSAGFKGSASLERQQGSASIKGTPSSYLSEQSQKDIVSSPQQKGSLNYSRVTKPNSEQISEIMTPQALNGKQVLASLDQAHSGKFKTQIKRNKSSIISQNQFKMLQSNRLSKLNLQNFKHKRATTQTIEANEQATAPSGNTDANMKAKMKPLHMISEDVGENCEDRVVKAKQKSKEKGYGVPFSLDKDGELILKDIDFSRGIEKIVKTMDLRQSQIMNNSYTFKQYLASYFKVLYGKQLYPNFLNFLTSASASQGESQEVIICLNRLCNPKLPEAYSIDLFKTFVSTVHKLHSVNQSALLSKNRIQILRYMLSYYLSQPDALYFQKRMIRQDKSSFISWFNCLELEVRSKALASELYRFLTDIMIQCEESLGWQLVEELTFFLSNEAEAGKNRIKVKYQLGQKILAHRFCFFCLKSRWESVLNIETTLNEQYSVRIGIFDQQKCIKNIQQNAVILEQFKGLSRYFNYHFDLHIRYDCGINQYLLRLIELNILEVKIKQAMPLSMDLRYLNLAFEGLQKKKWFGEMRQLSSSKKSHRNTTAD